MRMSNTFSFMKSGLACIFFTLCWSAYFSVVAVFLRTGNGERYEWAYQHVDRTRTNKEMEGAMNTGALLLNLAPLTSTLTPMTEADSYLGGDKQSYGAEKEAKEQRWRGNRQLYSQYGSEKCTGP